MNSNGYSNVAPTPETKEKRSIITVAYLIISFVCAVCLWFFVADYNTVVTKTFLNVPVEYIAPDDQTISIEAGDGHHVSVTVYGKKSDINSAKIDDFRILADASGATAEGSLEFTLRVEKLPKGLTLVDEKGLSPDKLTITLEKNIKKSFVISHEIVGSTINTEYVLKPECTPNKIDITGSKSVIDSIDNVVVKLDLGVIDSPKVIRTQVVLEDALGNEIPQRNLELSKEIIDVYVWMYMEKTLPLKVEFSGNFLDAETDATCTCYPSEVTVYGYVERLKDMEYIPIVFDETTIQGNTFSGITILPDYEGENFEYRNIDSKNVKIDIALRDVLSTQVVLTANDITYIGLAQGYKPQFSFLSDGSASNDSITLTFRGYSDSIRKLRDLGSAGLNCVVDFTGFTVSDGTEFTSIKVNVSTELTGIWTNDSVSVSAVINSEDNLSLPDYDS